MACKRGADRVERPLAEAERTAAGAAPLYFNQRAIDKLQSRKTKPATYYLDLNLVGAYCESLILHAAIQLCFVAVNLLDSQDLT